MRRVDRSMKMDFGSKGSIERSSRRSWRDMARTLVEAAE